MNAESTDTEGQLYNIFFKEIPGISVSFPDGKVVKNPPANAEDTRNKGSIPASERSPRERNNKPLQYSCLDNSVGRGAWWTPLNDWAHTHEWTHSLFKGQLFLKDPCSPTWSLLLPLFYLLFLYLGIFISQNKQWAIVKRTSKQYSSFLLQSFPSTWDGSTGALHITIWAIRKKSITGKLLTKSKSEQWCFRKDMFCHV